MGQETPADVIVYHHALEKLQAVAVGNDRRVLEEVLSGPERAARESAVTAYLDRVAAECASLAAFTAWAGTHRDLLGTTTFPQCRVEQWILCKEIVERRDAAAALESWDEWVQQRVCELSDSAELLGALTDRGRTRRIRARAADRLAELQRRQAVTSTFASELQQLATGGLTQSIRRRAEQRLRALGSRELPADAGREFRSGQP